MLMKRLQVLVKENPNTNAGSLAQKAGREIVIRFGLFKPSGKNLRSEIRESDYPELDAVVIELENPTSPASKMFLAILASFSQLGNKFKKGSELSFEDMDAIMDIFASDMSDGKFDGKDPSGASLVLPGGAPLGENALTNVILPALQQYIADGGKIGVGSSPVSVAIADLGTVSFQDSAVIASAVVPTASAPASLVYPQSSYSVPVNVPLAGITPTFSGTVTNCTVSPSLPAGLSLDSSTCSISGTPTASQSAVSYTVTASNSGGSTTAVLSISTFMQIIVSYTGGPYTYIVGTPITALTPSIINGPASSYSISPALSPGLNFNTSTGVISGTPSSAAGSANYTVPPSVQAQ